jgi:hypothetical protein
MDYAHELMKMRNDMHRNIVQEATVKTFLQQDGKNCELIMRIPFATDVNDISIIGVCCSSGNLISEDENGNRNTMRYHHLTLEELSMLHKAIVEVKDYKIKHLV